MSLDWGVERCENWEEFQHDETGRGKAVTHALVWGAFCGVYMGCITKKNADEWIWRIAFLKKLDRFWMQGGPWPEPDEVRRRVGLSTNCSSKTRKQFIKLVTESLCNEVTRDLERECHLACASRVTGGAEPCDCKVAA